MKTDSHRFARPARSVGRAAGRRSPRPRLLGGAEPNGNRIDHVTVRHHPASRRRDRHDFSCFAKSELHGNAAHSRSALSNHGVDRKPLAQRRLQTGQVLVHHSVPFDTVSHVSSRRRSWPDSGRESTARYGGGLQELPPDLSSARQACRGTAAIFRRAATGRRSCRQYRQAPRFCAAGPRSWSGFSSGIVRYFLIARFRKQRHNSRSRRSSSVRTRSRCSLRQ